VRIGHYPPALGRRHNESLSFFRLRARKLYDSHHSGNGAGTRCYEASPSESPHFRESESASAAPYAKGILLA